MGRTAFCETLKAKHQLAQSLFPNFLEYSRFVRRCNTLLPSKSFAKHSSLKRLKELVYRLLTASPFLCVSLFVISEAKFLEIMQMLATMLQRDSTSMDINVML